MEEGIISAATVQLPSAELTTAKPGHQDLRLSGRAVNEQGKTCPLSHSEGIMFHNCRLI